jgi:hypothetical protein
MDTEGALVIIPATKPASAIADKCRDKKLPGGSLCGLDMALGGALAWRQPSS